jgi:hypothetical protein
MTVKPNTVKNSEGGADPDNNSPITGDKKNNINAGGIRGIFNTVKRYL